MKATFLPLLERYPVDFILAGHEHHAEIFAPWKGMHFALVGHGSEIRAHVMPSDQPCLFRTNEIGFAELSLEEEKASLAFIDRHGAELWKLEVEKPKANAGLFHPRQQPGPSVVTHTSRRDEFPRYLG